MNHVSFLDVDAGFGANVRSACYMGVDRDHFADMALEAGIFGCNPGLQRVRIGGNRVDLRGVRNRGMIELAP